MALQLILGGSGSGKSYYLYDNIIKKSMETPNYNYIVVVPEQYTMETQKKLVHSHPRKGILNIDVVSFERLAYKVFEEIGGENRPVLDDTGKNLIVRKVLENNKKKMQYFGNSIHKTGFVSELKSVISEMLQYDIGLEKLADIRSQAGSNQLLCAKLDDISMIYAAFKEYMSTNYITSEEILDVLCQVIDKSEMIKNSEIIFDGFTGFTPIQYKLLGLLLTRCRGVQISVTIDPKEKINVYEGMQNLFFMSKDMIQKLLKLCDEVHVEVKNHVLLDTDVPPRFSQATELAFLEKNLFRYSKARYTNLTENIKLYQASVPKEEIQYVIGEVIRLTRQEYYRYRDIAIVTGDIASYGKLAANMMKQNDIPCFLDNKKPITDNPFVEFIRSALEIVERGYTYESMFRYLRTGMTEISREDVDYLDNYCMAVGVRGSKQWNEPWHKKFRKAAMGTDLERLNLLREQITAPLKPLGEVLKDKNASVRAYVTALYEFIVAMNIAQKLEHLIELPETGDEYEQLYKRVMELFDKIVALLGEEQVSLKEFNGIMDAGFEEMKVGLIPPTSDCVVVGDIERTRLDNVKVMFFVGVNDGIIPKKSENTSVLSETDRQFFEQLDVTLSPSARQKAFVQKFYLYLIMTKPSEKLYLSYSGKSSDGKSVLPSYLIRNLKTLYPQISVENAQKAQEQLSYIRIPKADILWSQENYIRTLGENAVLMLYGNEISGSVSAFETYASCRFAYFLQYGLRLSEREEYRFAVNDFGTVLHAVLEDVSKKVTDQKKSFSLLTEGERRKLVSDSIIRITQDYGNTILKDSSRNEFMIKRMSDLADRTVWAIGKQLECGEFAPDVFEMKFVIDEEEVQAGKRMSVMGKIDRIDICEDDENVYVKVIDYKSGNSDFDLLRTYYGLKLQLVTYMKAATHIEQLRHPDKRIVPAGIFYYHIDNPVIDMADLPLDNENQEREDNELDAVNIKIQEALRMKGIVNDNPSIIRKMDDTDGKSLAIPVVFKSNGELDARQSRVMSTEKFGVLEDFVTGKSVDMTSGIFQGSIEINPYESGTRNSCEYCPYGAVCGFTTDMQGSTYRHMKKFQDGELWKNIMEGVDENGRQLDNRSKKGN